MRAVFRSPPEVHAALESLAHFTCAARSFSTRHVPAFRCRPTRQGFVFRQKRPHRGESFDSSDSSSSAMPVLRRSSSRSRRKMSTPASKSDVDRPTVSISRQMDSAVVAPMLSQAPASSRADETNLDALFACLASRMAARPSRDAALKSSATSGPPVLSAPRSSPVEFRSPDSILHRSGAYLACVPPTVGRMAVSNDTDTKQR